jgi:hypothetical protein
MKIFVSENEFAGWMLGEIESLKKFKYFLKLCGVGILHNSRWVESKKSLDGRFRIF